MKKKFLMLCLFAMSAICSTAQRDTGSYLITVIAPVQTYAPTNPSGNSGFSNAWTCQKLMGAYLEDNTDIGIYSYTQMTQGQGVFVDTMSNVDVVVTPEGVISKFIIKSTNKVVKYTPYESCQDPKDATNNGESTVLSATILVTERNYAECLPLNKIGVDITSTPILRLSQPVDNVFPTDDAISIVGPYGFPSVIYNWEFSVDGGSSWLKFSAAYQNKDSITLTANQLFEGSGLKAANYVEKNILVRLTSCGPSYSPAIIYTIKKSSQALARVEVRPPACFDSEDGKIIFYFTDSLAAGETLNLNLKDSTHPGLFYQVQINQDSLGANNSYAFSEYLPSANYYLVYQTISKFLDQNSEIVTSYSNVKKSAIIPFTNEIAPTPVNFSTSDLVNVWCNGGSDGKFTITASGGVGGYQYRIKRSGAADSLWYPFSTATQQTITGLGANTWLIQVKDANDCLAKLGADGPIKTQSVVITEPAQALQINLLKFKHPTGYHKVNGIVEVLLTGGTALADGTYSFDWQGSDGTLLTNNIATETTPDGFKISFTKLKDGEYYLSTTDQNYNSGSTKAGCTASASFRMIEPPPLVAEIKIKDSILCFGDANGSLVAHIQGGVPYKINNPYKYTWKKSSDNTQYQIMPTATDSVLENMSTGWYALNVEDTNENILAIDSLFFLPQAPLLELSLSGTPNSCAALPNGTATASVKGGTPPYQYAWNTGDTTAKISNLYAGRYFVYITDYHHCQIQKNIYISYPPNLSLSFDVKNPQCFQSKDGSIKITMEGGKPPYQYTVNNQAIDTDMLTQLSAGQYVIKITDANGCSLSDIIRLEAPLPLRINLGADRFICANQSIPYTIRLAQPSILYEWTSNNDFYSNSPVVTLTRAGSYYARVTDLYGCSSYDTVVLWGDTETVLNSFALPSQVFTDDYIVAVNTTYPAMDSLRWQLPPEAQVELQTDKYAVFKILDSGTYTVGLQTFKGKCYATALKSLFVIPKDDLNTIGAAPQPFIQKFMVSPNPNTGSFNVVVELKEAAPIVLRLLNADLSVDKILIKQTGFTYNSFPISLHIAKGVYILVLETPAETALLKIIIL